MGHGHCHLFSVYSLSLNYFPPINSTIFNEGKRKKSNLPKIYILVNISWRMILCKIDLINYY